MSVGLLGLRMCNFMMLNKYGASEDLSLITQEWDEDASTSQFREEQMSLAEFIPVLFRAQRSRQLCLSLFHCVNLCHSL